MPRTLKAVKLAPNGGEDLDSSCLKAAYCGKNEGFIRAVRCDDGGVLLEWWDHRIGHWKHAQHVGAEMVGLILEATEPLVGKAPQVVRVLDGTAARWRDVDGD
jgi:hypothetical protein